jgi:hypothetical protein
VRIIFFPQASARICCSDALATLFIRIGVAANEPQ